MVEPLKETISVLKTQVEELSAEKGMSSRKIEDLQEELEVLRIELKSLVEEERKTAEENLEALQSNLEAERVVRNLLDILFLGMTNRQTD